ncbi:MAG: hypothetical protein ACRDKT_08900 [Actinomycetota bacterium]
MKRRLYAAALVMAAMAAACGGNSQAADGNTDAGSDTEQSATNMLDITMQDYAFAVDGEVTAGPALLNFDNVGEQFHHAIVGKLGEGKTLEDVQAFIAKGEQGPPPAWFDDAPIDQTLISPGQNAGIALDLEEGTYVLLCFMPDPKGQPHVAHGMAQTFEVAAGDAAEPIAPTASVAMTKEGVEAPELPAGESFLEVTNEDKIPGEVYVVQIPEGNSLDDLDKWFGSGQKGEAPVQFFGGTHAFGPGDSVTLQFDLEPGDYSIVASYGEGDDISDVPTEFTVEG